MDTMCGKRLTCYFIKNDALPSPGVNPLEGSPKCNCGKRDSEGAPGF